MLDRKTVSWLVACLSLMLVGNGCGGGEDPEEEKVIKTQLAATICVPDGFDATPKQMYITGHKTLPAVKPDVVFSLVSNPEIGVDSDYVYSNSSNILGDYYLGFFLYVDGGGTTQPVVDLDYMTITESMHTLDGTPIDLGEIVLELYHP